MPYYLRGPLVSYCSSTIALHILTRETVAHTAVIQAISAVWQKNCFHSRIVYICKYVKVAWFSVCTACLAPNISQIFFLLSLPHCTSDDWNGSEIRIVLKNQLTFQECADQLEVFFFPKLQFGSRCPSQTVHRQTQSHRRTRYLPQKLLPLL